MTRTVIYNTEPADKICRDMRWGLLLQVQMWVAGHSYTHKLAGMEATDYALESPDEMPAGSCIQDEYEADKDDPEDAYVVYARQSITWRES